MSVFKWLLFVLIIRHRTCLCVSQLRYVTFDNKNDSISAIAYAHILTNIYNNYFYLNVQLSRFGCKVGGRTKYNQYNLMYTDIVKKLNERFAIETILYSQKLNAIMLSLRFKEEGRVDCVVNFVRCLLCLCVCLFALVWLYHDIYRGTGKLCERSKHN